ncbi:16S rRNA (guanine(527)-N(7))-methyltransferase RsmG [Jatrophihabitans fulvus]
MPPDPSPSALAVFGDHVADAARYAALLAGDGVAHGHIGPREVPRLWDRHLTNSALLTDLLPHGACFVDVGSGAGLPGLPMALRRPDLKAVLLEPMSRRTRFLDRAVTELGLSDRVSVVRGRADDAGIRRDRADNDWVVARAVAPLDRLVGWCLPLLRPGGVLLALKGERAADEATEHERAVVRAGGSPPRVVSIGAGDDRTWVIRIERIEAAPRARTRGRR